MKKLSRIMVSFLLVLVLGLGTMLTGCGNEASKVSKDEPQKEKEVVKEEGTKSTEKVKIGVLIYDPTDSQVLAFQKYYTEYIEKNFNVEFKFSSTINTAEDEKSAIENFAIQKCSGVIALTQSDMVAAIKQAADSGMYYIVGVGTMTDEQYELTKDNEYFLGTIGPDLNSEEQAGYDMAKSYIAQGFKNYVVYAGGISYGVDAHRKRFEGMVKAFEEAGVTYNQAESGGTLGKFEGEGYTISTIEGFPDEAGAFFAEASQKVGEPGVEVLMCVGVGLEIFGATVANINPDIKLSTVSSFTDVYESAFAATPQQVDFLGGTFASMVGPSFAAIINAVNGDGASFRENGQAFRIGQNYWSATSKETFNEMYKVANDFENPVFSAEDLKSIIKAENPEANMEAFNELAANTNFDYVKSRLAKR